jgi:hypothetical protein
MFTSRFTKREKKFRQTFEKMEGFSFLTPVTGLSRPNTGKEDDDIFRFKNPKSTTCTNTGC